LAGFREMSSRRRVRRAEHNNKVDECGAARLWALTLQGRIITILELYSHSILEEDKLRKFVFLAAFAVVCTFAVTQAQASPFTTTVVIPDPAPNAFLFFGNGNASVTYSNVTFVQQAALGDANLFNVGFLFSGDPAVLSSQGESFGVANILVELPNFTTFFSVDYGTFFGSPVTFLASNGATATFGSTAAGYQTLDSVSYSGPPIDWVEITSSDLVLNINNITYNTPEPGTIVMLGSGLLALGGALRRKVNL